MAIYGESGDSWSPAPGNKLHERETILCRRMEEGKAEYEAMVSQTNALQKEILGTTLPQACIRMCVCVYVSMYKCVQGLF